jgi:integrase
VYLGCDPITGKKRQRSRVVYGTKHQASTVAELTTEALDRWYVGLVRAGVTAANIRNHHAMLRRALNHGGRWGWLPSNPALAATPPRVPTRHVVAMRAGDVIAAANAAVDESLLAGLCVRLAAVTGARRGELVGLQWGDLDGELLTISRNVTTVSLGNVKHHQPVQLNVGATKTHSRRRITLDVESVALLWRWRETCETRANAIGSELGPWIVSEAEANISPCSRIGSPGCGPAPGDRPDWHRIGVSMIFATGLRRP